MGAEQVKQDSRRFAEMGRIRFLNRASQVRPKYQAEELGLDLAGVHWCEGVVEFRAGPQAVGARRAEGSAAAPTERP